MFALAAASLVLAPRPNFVIILADDLGYGDVGYMGSSIPTPHIDALAEGGLKFTDFHSNGAVCSPTRAALMTGRYQQRSGIEGVVTAANHRHTGLPLTEKTMAEYLGAAGYRTGLFGKWHLGYRMEFGPRAQGFHDFVGFVSGNVDYQSKIDQEAHKDWWVQRELIHEEGYLTHLITDHSRRFIRESDRPFLLVVAHGAPHYPLQGPSDGPIRAVGDRNAFPAPDRPRKETYAQMIVELDQSVGDVVKELDDTGKRDNTLVIFLSDNGPAADGSSGGLRGRKGSLWEGGHRVPMAASWPGIIEPGESSETATGTDLLPTFASLAGLRDSKRWDGVDLSSLMLEGDSLAQRDLFWRHQNGQTAMRRGPWKWVSMEGGRLFRLDADLAEKTDLAELYPRRAAGMASAVKAWEKDVLSGHKRRS